MQKIDALIRQIPASKVTTGFSCQTKDFHDLLFKIADKRHRDVESELKCYKRLIRDSKRFEKIFQERAGNLITKSILSKVLFVMHAMAVSILFI